MPHAQCHPTNILRVNRPERQGRAMPRAQRVEPKELRRVVIAASVGNIIEWYDFYIFGSLAAILAVKFFEKGHPVAAFLSTVAIFSVGFLIRPLGAFFFGWLGDKVGRKYTFIVTLTGMGLAAAPLRYEEWPVGEEGRY